MSLVLSNSKEVAFEVSGGLPEVIEVAIEIQVEVEITKQVAGEA